MPADFEEGTRPSRKRIEEEANASTTRWPTCRPAPNRSTTILNDQISELELEPDLASHGRAHHYGAGYQRWRYLKSSLEELCRRTPARQLDLAVAGWNWCSSSIRPASQRGI